MQGFAEIIRYFPDSNRWSAKLLEKDWHIFVPTKNLNETEKLALQPGGVIKVTQFNDGAEEAVAFVDASEEYKFYVEQIEALQAQERQRLEYIEKLKRNQIEAESQARQREAIERQELMALEQVKLEASFPYRFKKSLLKIKELLFYASWAVAFSLIVAGSAVFLSALPNAYNEVNSFTSNRCLGFTVKSIGGCDASGACKVELSRWFHDTQYRTVRYPAVGMTVPICTSSSKS